MTVSLTEYANIRRLVAAANNELWYEANVATGEMTELVAADGDIDTTDQLNMFEAYQRACIVNGSNLKIADFGSIKLTSSALSTVHAHGDLLTQDQGDGDVAYMIVGYTNAVKTMTYGQAYYAGDAVAFTTDDTITGSGSGSGFTPSDVTNPPHWYDWIAYPDGSSGTIPGKAYLGCLFNGRAVLTGNPEEPNQWYMSRQGNIFDWEYNATDDQAPVKGRSTDLGELGDIPRCLAPYKDDYLVYGCASSIWFCAGDPRMGGQIRELSLTTGIFGANSYCWDNENWFYFWGNNGLYRTRIPGNPQCISQFKLPRLVKDEAASPLTHRITLLYDRDRHGILVAITVLDSGNNSNYWYDLNALDEQEVGGFFPESYPSSCGIYSGVYYNSNTALLKGLILGNTDGHIRHFDDVVKSDMIAGSPTAIKSYVCVGPIAMSAMPQRNGTLSGVNLTVAGVQPSGQSDDSDDVDFKVYTARTSEGTIKAATANTAPNFAGTFVGPGNVRGTTRRQTTRNAFMSIRLQNTAPGESWAFENLLVHLKDSGRKK